MEQNWHSVDDCLPFMLRTYPDYPNDRRRSTFHEFLVRGIDTAVQKNPESHEYENIEYWIYSVARLMYTYKDDEWQLQWDCQCDAFWHMNGIKITHWMDLGYSQVSTILDDNSEDE